MIITDQQVEEENILTRNVTNYNHSHALTIQYYEVIQKYQISTSIASIEYILWIQFHPLNFTIDTVQEYWYLLKLAVARFDSDLLNQFENTLRSSIILCGNLIKMIPT